jgi:hypothetical protein
MKRHLIQAFVVLSAAVINVGRGEEDLGPIGLPPLFGTVSNSDGKGFLEYRCYATREVDRGRNGIKQVIEERLARTDIAEDSDRGPAGSNIRVFDLDGKRLKKDDAAKRLKEGTAVMICADGQPLSKFYRQHLKSDILVLVVPKSPVANFTPLPKGKGRP